MLIAKIALDLLKMPFKRMEEIRNDKFWSNDLLSSFDRNIIKYYTFQQYLLYFLAFLALSNFGSSSFSHPKFIFNDNWPLNLKRGYKIFFFLYSICGYYIGNAIETYHTYGVLHSHFQIKTIASYILLKLEAYESLPFKKKVYSKSYQRAVHDILLQSIQQYQVARRLLK